MWPSDEVEVKELRCSLKTFFKPENNTVPLSKHSRSYLFHRCLTPCISLSMPLLCLFWVRAGGKTPSARGHPPSVPGLLPQEGYDQRRRSVGPDGKSRVSQRTLTCSGSLKVQAMSAYLHTLGDNKQVNYSSGLFACQVKSCGSGRVGSGRVGISKPPDPARESGHGL